MARVIRGFRGGWCGVVVCTLGLMLQGCSFDPTLSAGAKLHCNVNSECPKSRVCRGGFCIDPTTIDLVAPELAEPIQVAPPKGRAGTVFSVALVSTKPLITTPRLTLHMEQPTFVECIATNETLHYRCDYTAIGSENSGLGGVVDFDVRLVDTSGNETVKRFAGTLQMDFSPPVLAAATVSPEVARLGATLEVFLTASEPLSGPVQLTSSVPLDDGAGGKASTFSVNAEGATLNYRLTHVVSAGDPTGDVAFTAVMTDTVGNTSAPLTVGTVQIDATVPVLRNAMVTPERATIDTVVVATFEVSKPLVGFPSTTLGGIAMVRDASVAPPNYRYTYKVQAQDKVGLKGVLVTGSDAAGNSITESIGAVTFDVTAPKLVAVTALYIPDPSNVITAVTKAKAGTVITVSVIADEPLSTSPGLGNPPTLTATFGSTTLTFCVVGLTCPNDTRPNSYTSTGATFEVNVPQSAIDGVYTPALTWTDLAGNTATVSFITPTIQVKTSTPVLAINQGQVTFVRSPWGNAASENLGAFTIPSGAYFALAPANALSNVATLPANTFTLTNGVVQRLRVWTSASSGTLLGSLVPNSDGTWPRQRLTNLDVPTAYLTGFDEAGNESVAVKLNNAEWVATANFAGAGVNPNRINIAATVSPALVQPSSQAASGTEGADAVAALVRAETTWTQVTGSAIAPSARSGHALAYDSARGRVVMFGGTDGALRQDVWEWDGISWLDKTPAGTRPSARSGHAMAYDSARNRVVMFGGFDGVSYLQDVWEWDGVDWVNKTPAGLKPSSRRTHAIAFDSARGRVVMFGGFDGVSYLQDIWEWDGVDWMNGTPAGPKPAARRGHAMAYDSLRGRVVMFGGWNSTNGPNQDIWEWNGLSWVDKTPVGPKPSARMNSAMAYDSGRGRVVLFGGDEVATYPQDIWEWDGSSWVDKTPAGIKPNFRIDHGMAYDAARRRVVLFGGWNGFDGFQQNVWEWDGAVWVNMSPTGTKPPARVNHTMAYDSSRSRVVMFGGYNGTIDLQDLWEWDGVSWVNKTPAGIKPPARSGHAMVYDSGRNRIVVFGGSDLQDTWEWDGAVWTNKTPVGTKPIGRTGHAMAYDSARSRTVMFGGLSNTNGFLQDVWEWDGLSWTAKATGPRGRWNHEMAYDSSRSRVVMFGGIIGGFPVTLLADVWEWNGVSWTDKTPTGTKPVAGGGYAMTYDSARNRVVLLGGYDGTYRHDVWEWNGVSWVDKKPPGIKPTSVLEPEAAYDSARGRVVMFGGNISSFLQDTWEWDATAARQPSVSFLANAAGYVSSSDVSSIRVRAHCGGAFSPYATTNVGATLYGWATGRPASPPGFWRVLGVNSTGINASSPWLPPSNAALIDWTATSTTEARQFILERDGQLGFQCRPSGSSGVSALEASVALDYIEVRLRYTSP